MKLFDRLSLAAFGLLASAPFSVLMAQTAASPAAPAAAPAAAARPLLLRRRRNFRAQHHRDHHVRGLRAVPLGITKWASARNKSAADFYSAGGNITGFQNGLALAGDYMSAASFLGISASSSLGL